MPQVTNSLQFHFTETAPTPLLKDFETFARYLEQNAFALGKATEHIPYKPLAALNAAMTHPNTEGTSHTPQHFYPQLHLYYHLALAGKLFRRVYRKDKAFLEATERLAAYRALSAAEKYFFLLETLWIDCSWEELGNRPHSFTLSYQASNFLEALGDCKPDLPIFANDGPALFRSLELFLPRLIIECFALFGWYEAERDEARYQQLYSKELYPIARLTPSALGVTLAQILARRRPFLEWNIPNLRSEGMLPARRKSNKKASPDFARLFRHLCADDELRSTLPREVPQTAKGNFIFKVSVAPKVWRTIALSSKHTLDDLHYAIQDAFDFDADHLYAFYMDNRWCSDERFESPHSSEGPWADEIEIGELGLAANQPFIYHFDFGDDWRFDVILLEIKTGEPLLKKPKILETHGKAPEQYPEADW
ncbi:plasmid pRiA4b ORF-3 family protein [candidate division KSB1 bacterium]|nr:plasmid pRiA4b ORF-3 family protein [candidate division KSB1 bacterium]